MRFDIFSRDFWGGGSVAGVSPSHVDNGRGKVLINAKRQYGSLRLECPTFPIEFIVLHHSLTHDGKRNDYKNILRYHVKYNGWSTIGYHVLNEETWMGYKIKIGRPLSMRGAHAKDGGFNSKSIGVCVVGNFDERAPNPNEWLFAQVLCACLAEKFTVQNKNIIGHREAQAIGGLPIDNRKSCPGRMWDMGKFRKELAGVRNELAVS